MPEEIEALLGKTCAELEYDCLEYKNIRTELERTDDALSALAAARKTLSFFSDRTCVYSVLFKEHIDLLCRIQEIPKHTPEYALVEKTNSHSMENIRCFLEAALNEVFRKIDKNPLSSDKLRSRGAHKTIVI
ncbi:MAG: uncharacterized protein A8A55_1060 [Amphiamblys sp. WSBS2006]|nr:MAG: uncharacterized protein A8A55_1060 [Amphiamblys sp. WSBS2006]